MMFGKKDSSQAYDEVLALEQEANEAEAVALEEEERAREAVRRQFEAMKTMHSKDGEVSKARVNYYDALLREI